MRADNAEPGFHALAINCTLIVIQRGLLHACPQERRVHLHSRAGDFAKHLTNHDIDIVARMLLHELTQWRFIMFSFRPALVGVVVAIAVLLDVGAARAAPIVDIWAYWNVGLDSDYGLPDSRIALSCYGDAAGSDGCASHVHLDVLPTGTSHWEARSVGGVVVTNMADVKLEGWLVLSGSVTSFSPAGMGIAIDDPLTQWASMTTSVHGDYFGDSHACSIGFLGESGHVYSPTACGVHSPDSSEFEFGIDLSDFDPFEVMYIPIGIDITADFVFADPPQGVPEPASGLIVIAGLGLIAWRRYRRAPPPGTFC